MFGIHGTKYPSKMYYKNFDHSLKVAFTFFESIQKISGEVFILNDLLPTYRYIGLFYVKYIVVHNIKIN